MNDFKIWCIGICSLLIVTSVMRFIVPESKMKKVSSSVISLIIVLLLFSPLKNNNVDVSNKFKSELEEFTATVSEGSQYNIALERYISDTLSSQNIEIENIKVICELDSEGYIVISEISIETLNEDDIDNIRQVIKNICKLDDEKVKFN